MAMNVELDAALLQGGEGLTLEEKRALLAYGRAYMAEGMYMPDAIRRRLVFVRWLVQTGRMSEEGGL